MHISEIYVQKLYINMKLSGKQTYCKSYPKFRLDGILVCKRKKIHYNSNYRKLYCTFPTHFKQSTLSI